MKLEYLNRVIIGCWQLAEGHSDRQPSTGLAVIEACYEAGFRVFDCADIYTGVEDLLGAFIRAHGLGPQDIKIHTKYVPDAASLPSLSREQIERAIDRSRSRLGVGRLDLVQFHWWDYRILGWLETLDILADLQQQGKIAELGLTNFDAERTEEIVARGVPIAAIQTQYSLLDRRPRQHLAPLAQENDIALLCYGSVAGGLLSDAYLGQNPPREPYENRSLLKYLLILEETGGWDALQDLLRVLREIADERQTDIAAIACAYCLSQEAVRACIVGVRHTGHLEQLALLRGGLRLSESDLARIETARSAFAEVPGAVYELERDRASRHGRIMRYDLNAEGHARNL